MTYLKIIPKKGDEFTEKELQLQFSVGNSGGIRPSNKNRIIILINSFSSKKQGGYKNEVDEKTGFVYYVGAGDGVQKMARHNKSLSESQYNGYTLLYFDKLKQNRLIYRFQLKYDSCKLDSQKNSIGKFRNVFIFKLKIIDK